MATVIAIVVASIFAIGRRPIIGGSAFYASGRRSSSPREAAITPRATPSQLQSRRAVSTSSRRAASRLLSASSSRPLHLSPLPPPPPPRPPHLCKPTPAPRPPPTGPGPARPAPRPSPGPPPTRAEVGL